MSLGDGAGWAAEGIGLSIRVLELELEMLTPLGLGRNVGAAVRAAVFESLRSNLNVCLHKELSSCQPCPLRQVCPLSGLLATVDDEAPRGHDAPRPMALRPPEDGRRFYEPGNTIHFGVSLFGEGEKYIPYLVLATQELERSGLGLRRDAPRRLNPERGKVRLGEVAISNPLTRAREVIRSPGVNLLRASSLAVTSADVLAYARTLRRDAVTLDLRTPIRLIEGGQLVHPLRFDALVRRLLDRLESLGQHYGTGAWPFDSHALITAARDIAIIQDATRWVDLEAHSTRTGRFSPTGGYLGRITFGGELAPFLPLLVWGSLTQVGKSTTRGNGLYRIEAGVGVA